MSTDEQYNGWTNRETWAVALHINNDQGWQESVHDALREHVEETTADGEDVKIWHAGDVIRQNVEAMLDPWSDMWGETGDNATIGVDLFRIIQDIGSLWRVNWTELGAAFLDDIAEG